MAEKKFFVYEITLDGPWSDEYNILATSSDKAIKEAKWQAVANCKNEASKDADNKEGERLADWDCIFMRRGSPIDNPPGE